MLAVIDLLGVLAATLFDMDCAENHADAAKFTVPAGVRACVNGRRER